MAIPFCACLMLAALLFSWNSVRKARPENATREPHPVLNHFRRLPIIRRLLPAKARPILWAALCNGGIVVALARGTRAGPVRIALSDRSGTIVGPIDIEPRPTTDGRLVAQLPVAPEIFAGPRGFRLDAVFGGHAISERVETGPGRAAIRFDGIVDHHLRGWASALSDERGIEVALVVDGRAGPAQPLRVFRPDLMQVGREGGWNGFSLRLPPEALDRHPHDLAVRGGTRTFPFRRWAAKPVFHIDHVGPDRLTGWFVDLGAIDEPATIRLIQDGETVATTPTGFRPDLKERFGRDFAAFAFTGTPLRDGLEVVTGLDGAERVLGLVRADDLNRRVTARRAEARALLLGDDPAATLPARRRLRDDLVAVRADPPSGFRFELGSDGAAVSGATVETVLPNGIRSEPPACCAIVPVYKGTADTRLCLESLIPQLGPGRRAIVIDDGSPEPELGAYLAELARREISSLAILANPVNLGFVGTVNRAFALLEPGEDAVLVNADTILPPDAIARLARACHARPGIASVTPMSNNATILSFPNPSRPNPPALGLDTAAIDAAFRAVGALPVELPTGIGFCMYLNGRALAEAGAFSPEWGRGYCEEVDWSLAARDLGWVHVAARDIFVMHEGSVSFGTGRRSAILDVNHARLETKYPDYLPEVHAIVAADPSGPVRTRVLARLLASRFRRLTLLLTHGLGGGTKRYVDDLRALERRPDHEVGIVSPAGEDEKSRRLRFAFDSGPVLEMRMGEFEAALAILEDEGLEIVLHLNSRLVFPAALLRSVVTGGRPYLVTLHDFQWYCPKVHLVDERVFYCGEPPPDICQLCVRHYQEHDFGDQNALIQDDIESWIAFNAELLRGAARVIAPSRDTAERYARRLGLTGIEVVPHLEPPPDPPRETAPHGRAGALRIALVGALGMHKGFDLVVRMVEDAERRRLPVYFRIVGLTPNGGLLEHLSNVDVTGAYDPADLKKHLDSFDPDFVFMASVWPETFSYVLSEVWAAGYPVAAFDFGAPAERIREAGGGVLIPPTRDAREVLDALFAARASRPVAPRPTPALAPSFEAYYGRDP